MNVNPYDSSGMVDIGAIRQPVRRRVWAWVGFAVFGIPIAAMGFFGIYAQSHYSAADPTSPRCGMGELVPMFLVFPCSQIFGCFGAVIGLFIASVYNASLASQDSSKDNQV